MKALFAIFLTGCGLAMAGCESDVPPTQSGVNKLERGISGQGTLTQPDKSDEPGIRETMRTGD
jgi:hypothetical protein